jgi:hypothetical protein
VLLSTLCSPGSSSALQYVFRTLESSAVRLAHVTHCFTVASPCLPLLAVVC